MTTDPIPPPHSIEAEQALLGALLYRNDRFEDVPELAPHHFFDPVHGRIFEEIAKAIASNRRADPITLAPHLADVGDIGPLRVGQYLTRLVAHAPTLNARSYAETVLDLHKRRHLIVLAEIIQRDAMLASDLSPAVQIENAEAALYALGERGSESRVYDGPAAATAAVEMAHIAYQRGDRLAGLPTGLTDIDGSLGGLAPQSLVILAGRPAMGKDQPLDAKILMRDGSWKEMGQIRLGDELASVDGARSIVSGVFPQGFRQMYRLTFSDGRSTEAGAEHLWKVSFRHWDQPRLMTTVQIACKLQRKRYKGRLWIDYVSGHFGNSVELPIEPWLLGQILANGGITGSSVNITSGHPCVLEKVAINASFHTTRYASTGPISCRIVAERRGDTNYVLTALRDLGLSGCRSEEKFIPSTYLQASREARRQLLMGLIDGDGWVEKFGAMRYATSSHRLAQDVAYLARSLGGWVSSSVKSPRYTHKGEIRCGLQSFVLNIVLPAAKDFVSVPAKQDRLPFERNGTKRLTFKSVVPSRLSESQCIRVTHPSRQYVTDDFIVTHNTSLAMNMAYHNARNGVPVGIFSLEMSASEIALRVLSERTGTPSNRWRTGKVGQNEMHALKDEAATMAGWPVWIDESGGISIAQLAMRARRMRRKHGIKLLVVDYLQLMRGESRRGSRVEDVSEITTGMKALAKELDIPVLALSQLSRGPEGRENKRPQLADLRESGSIEQDADSVLFVFREDYYVARDEPKGGDYGAITDWKAKMAAVQGTAEIIIAKNRHGPTATVKVAFNGALTRFSDLAAERNSP